MRQIVLDTETTGLETALDHRIIEIGAVELVNRRLTGRHFHRYINPGREVDQGAMEVHGITDEFLRDKPDFARIADEFIAFVDGAELVIHNAPFDVGFLDHELGKLGPQYGRIADYCRVIDTLVMARQLHPGQKNNLDALCKRYQVDNARRDLHGGLLDAEILADVYLAMTGGQVALGLRGQSTRAGDQDETAIRRLSPERNPLPVIAASGEELEAHARLLDTVARQSGGDCLWPRNSAQGTE